MSRSRPSAKQCRLARTALAAADVRCLRPSAPASSTAGTNRWNNDTAGKTAGQCRIKNNNKHSPASYEQFPAVSLFLLLGTVCGWRRGSTRVEAHDRGEQD